MSSIPLTVRAVIAKMNWFFDPLRVTSLEGFLKLMGLKYDPTTNRYQLNISLDTQLNAEEELIYISEVINRYMRYEMALNLCREDQEKRQQLLKKNYKKNITKKAKVEKEKRQLKRKIRRLQRKIQRRERYIAPKPISKETTHYLTVTKLRKPNMYRWGRVQERNIKPRLSQIAEEEDLSFEEVEEKTKRFKGLPHSVDTASSLRDFLKKKNLKVDGKTQTFEWRGTPKELYKLISLFLNRENKNILPDAEKMLKTQLITDYFPAVDK